MAARDDVELDVTSQERSGERARSLKAPDGRHHKERTDTFDAPKPLLRGWLHLGAAPIVFLAGIFLVASGPTFAGRLSAAVFTITAVILFGTSAVYHRGTWGEGMLRFLRRLDHANIFLIIAGTYTPLVVLLLPHGTAVMLLWIVWGGAISGALMRILWLSAPRWLYTPLYVALGWVAMGFMGPFRDAGGAAVMWLVVAGGVAYTAGALIYGFKWPNPSPKYFGFHEIFHSLTILGFVCHFVAASIAIYRA
jgi:hemolysin III